MVHSIIPLYCSNTIIRMKNSRNYLQSVKPLIAIYLMFNAIDITEYKIIWANLKLSTKVIIVIYVFSINNNLINIFMVLVREPPEYQWWSTEIVKYGTYGAIVK